MIGSGWVAAAALPPGASMAASIATAINATVIATTAVVLPDRRVCLP
jgi:hypothetical protein